MSALVLAGLPHAGKTTYLALLFAAMMDGRHIGIRLDSFQDDREYANDLATHLINCERADHTPVGHGQGLSLAIVAGEISTRLVAPDVSGETWHELLRDRQWPEEFRNQVTASEGICIFVNAGDFREDPPIDRVNHVEKGEATEARPDDAYSTQVDLVDLFQILAEQDSYQPHPKRISLIISAYDVAGEENPSEWLAMNAPLVAQYVSSNAKWLQLAVFGVSAQGGSFEDKTVREKLLEGDAVERAFVKSGDGTPVNFDSPVLWALSLD